MRLKLLPLVVNRRHLMLLDSELRPRSGRSYRPCGRVWIGFVNYHNTNVEQFQYTK
jgi:hypothetical protein